MPHATAGVTSPSLWSVLGWCAALSSLPPCKKMQPQELLISIVEVVVSYLIYIYLWEAGPFVTPPL